EDPRNGRYRLYSDVENPLQGTPTEALARSAIGDIKASAKAAMDDFDKTARDIAAQRVMDAKNHPAGGTISTATATPEPVGPSDKELKALEKLRNELRSILEQTNPVTAAEEKLAHAQDVVNHAVDKGLLSWAQGATAMDNYRRKEADALDPMGAWVRKQIEATAALRDDLAAQERAAQLTSFEQELQKQGLVLTDQQVQQARHLIEVRQRQGDLMRAEQQFTQQILGPQKTYHDQLAALGDLLERGRLSAEQYGRAVDGVRATYLAATQEGKTVATSFEQELQKQGLVLTDQQVQQARHLIEVRQRQGDLMRAEQQFTQQILGPQKTYHDQLAALGDLLERGRLSAEQYGRAVDGVRATYLAATQEGKTVAGGFEQAWLKAKADAGAFGQTLANTLVADVDKLNESLVTMANGGAVSWSTMIDSMIQDLERLILKQLEVAAINAIITAATGVPVPGVTSATAGGGTPGAEVGIPRLAPSSAAVAGARVGAYPYSPTLTGAAAPAPAPPAPKIIIVNQYDPSAVLAAIDSPEGAQVVLNHLRANPGAVRSYAGGRR
ncbi:MAG: hypothetical protein E6J90_27120, partial [Deltaproteobacteria bacterium]